MTNFWLHRPSLASRQAQPFLQTATRQFAFFACMTEKALAWPQASLEAAVLIQSESEMLQHHGQQPGTGIRMKPTSRTLVGMAIWPILAAAILLAAPAKAQMYDPNYPVCLQIYNSMVDYYFECAYTSMPQCQASASGRAAQCVVNPFYKPQANKPGRHKKRTHTP